MKNDIFKEIKSKTSIVDELEKRGIEVKDKGSRKVCLCPLHGEKSPSFFITNEGEGDEFFKCFGCGEGGDVISLVFKIEKIKNPEWSMRDTLNYFSINYKIDLGHDFSIKELLEKRINQSKQTKELSLMPQLGVFYDEVRDLLKKSNNPEFDFKRYSKLFKNIDESIEASNKIDFNRNVNILRDLLNNVFKKHDDYNLSEECRNCKECPFFSNHLTPLPGIGNIKSGVFIVSDYPSFLENDKKNYFYGERGGEFKKILNELEIYNNDFWFTYCINFNVDIHNEFFLENAKVCFEKHLKKQIEFGDPETIILLGDIPKKILTPVFKDYQNNKLIGKYIEKNILGKKRKILFNYGLTYMSMEGFKDPKKRERFKNIFKSIKK